jgi:hypothetical protein
MGSSQLLAYYFCLDKTPTTALKHFSVAALQRDQFKN